MVFLPLFMLVSCDSADQERNARYESQKEKTRRDYKNMDESVLNRPLNSVEEKKLNEIADKHALDLVPLVEHRESSNHQSNLRDLPIESQPLIQQVEAIKNKILSAQYCEYDHRKIIEKAYMPMDVLINAKWMLEQAIVRTRFEQKGWYGPKGNGTELDKIYPIRTKKERHEYYTGYFKNRIVEEEKMLIWVTALIQLNDHPTTTTGKP